MVTTITYLWFVSRFITPAKTFLCTLRSYIRQRDNLIKSASTHVLRMQLALTEMNVQLHRVISDITGITGMAIINAIE